jgi:hypothetical protein
MGKNTVTEGLAISRVFRRHGLYVMFFGYVSGHKDANPNATWAQIADGFMRRYGLTDDDIDSAALIREASRMTNDFMKFGL